MNVLKLGQQGQVTIPVEIRKQLGLKAGDKFDVMVEGEQIVLFRQPPRINDITRAFGLYKATHSVSLEEMDEAIARAVLEENGFS